ncbi:MAG: tetratricopeptide repeat protein [Crocinitomicaceae bacterium]|nr:tetratricopeptide repeat protein [Crocinitomicaceae bacterium]
MIKYCLHILILLAGFSVSAQEWRDSLDVARAAYEDEDYIKALKYYESAQRKAPDDIDLSEEMGQSAYKAREFERAEKIYQQSGADQVDAVKKANNYHNLGNSRMKQQDYAGAIDAYKESLRLNPNDDQTRYNMSEAIRKLKQQQQNQGGQSNQENQGNQGNQSGQGNQGNQNGNQSGNQGNQGNDPSDGNGPDNGSTLPNRTVDRMLEKLMKDEAETKRKMNGSQGDNKSSASGRDW